MIFARAELFGVLSHALEPRELGTEAFLEGSLLATGDVLVLVFC